MDFEVLGLTIAISKKAKKTAQEACKIAQEAKETAEAAKDRAALCVYTGTDGKFYIDSE